MVIQDYLTERDLEKKLAVDLFFSSKTNQGIFFKKEAHKSISTFSSLSLFGHGLLCFEKLIGIGEPMHTINLKLMSETSSKMN